MKQETKGHGYFRKNKAYGLVSGIALGTALLFGGNVVSADEVKADNTPATEVKAPTPEKQPEIQTSIQRFKN